MIDAGSAGESNEPVKMDVRIRQNGRSGSSEETRSKRSCRRMEGAQGRRKAILCVVHRAHLVSPRLIRLIQGK